MTKDLMVAIVTSTCGKINTVHLFLVSRLKLIMNRIIILVQDTVMGT